MIAVFFLPILAKNLGVKLLQKNLRPTTFLQIISEQNPCKNFGATSMTATQMLCLPDRRMSCGVFGTISSVSWTHSDFFAVGSTKNHQTLLVLLPQPYACVRKRMYLCGQGITALRSLRPLHDESSTGLQTLLDTLTKLSSIPSPNGTIGSSPSLLRAWTPRPAVPGKAIWRS